MHVDFTSTTKEIKVKSVSNADVGIYACELYVGLQAPYTGVPTVTIPFTCEVKPCVVTSMSPTDPISSPIEYVIGDSLNLNLPMDYVQSPACGYTVSYSALDNGLPLNSGVTSNWISLDIGFGAVAIQS